MSLEGSELCGLIFAVHTFSGGDQLVFRYPSIPKGLPESASEIVTKPQALTSSPVPKSSAKNMPSLTGHPYQLPSDLIAGLLIPKRQLCDRPFELRLDDTIFIGKPTLLTSEKESSDSQQENGEKKQSASGAKYETPTVFNLVFVLNSENRGNVYKEAYQSVAQQFSTALKHEQIRCAYLSTELHEVMAIREQWNTSKDRDYIRLADSLLAVSTLCQMIRDVYHSLCNTGQFSTVVNGLVTIGANLRIPQRHPLYPIRPYHSFLSLKKTGRGEGDTGLPPNASPLLRRFLTAIQPTKSFQDVHQETGIPLATLFQIAAHLIYWDFGRIIHTLSWGNIYVNAPNASLSDELCKEFVASFPRWKLPDTLAAFSQPSTLGEQANVLNNTMRRDLVNVVVWLLRHKLVLQYHKYVQLVIPRHAPARFEPPRPDVTLSSSISSVPRLSLLSVTGERNSTSGINALRSSSASLLDRALDSHSSIASEVEPASYPLAPVWLEPHEIAYLETLNDGTELNELFRRLCPFFRGKHHTQEIMWRENVSKEDLAKVIETYQQVLVVCLLPSLEHGS